MKNNTLVQLSLFVAAALLIGACGSQPTDKSAQLAKLKEQKTKIEAEISALEQELGAPAGAPQKIHTVSLTEVQPAQFRHYIDIQGKVDAEENVPVTSKASGVLSKVLVKNGDVVKRGQLLAIIDDQLMLKGLAELELQLQTATDLYNRQKALWDQKIGTEVQFIQAKTNKEAVEQRIATTKEQWQMTRIYAPISGSVDYVMLKAGQAISPGLPLCNIVNLSNLKITGEVPEAYAAKVNKGDAVVLYFPDLKKEVNSRVTYVSKTISPTTRTFVVECALPAGADYRANMIAVMKIIDYQNNNALVVPVNLIQTAADGDFVLTVDKSADKQGAVRKTPIKQGNNYNGMVEVTDGLKKGDHVISVGFQDVNPGETVNF